LISVLIRKERSVQNGPAVKRGEGSPGEDVDYESLEGEMDRYSMGDSCQDGIKIKINIYLFILCFIFWIGKV